jgi:HPt (histidine-containing phosphotransfer) domain-containing protein
MAMLVDRLDSALDPLADLRGRFIERSLQRVAMLRAALAGDRPSVAMIAPLAHQLAGSAGTFGYAALGRAAATLEDVARAAGSTGAPLDVALIRPHLLALEWQLARADPTRPDPAPCEAVSALKSG